jgi:protein-tyrosine phosphatase
MRPELYWIEGPWPGRLAIVPRPRSGDWLEDEVRAWRQSGINVVVSLLTRDEITELDLVREAEFCQSNGISFLSFPIPDRRVPSSQRATLDLLEKLDKLLSEGKNVAIHCRQGIGRAPLIAACLLILSRVSLETAFQRVSAARGCSIPETPEQRQWVVDFAREVITLHPNPST